MQIPAQVRKNVLLGPMTWWKIGGAAEYLAQPTSIEDLQEIVRWAAMSKIPITMMGGGSNILVSDSGVSGLVILTRSLNRVESFEIQEGRLKIVALAGANKAELTKLFMKHKLAPALFLCGLPGEVGGGVVMNAGVGEKIVPREFCEIVDWVEVIQTNEDQAGNLKRLNGEDLEWSYRSCKGWQPGVIARVQVSWENKEIKEVLDQVRAATKNRNARQPLDMPSCGSTFRNPEGGKAGALIEAAGLKGYQVGQIQVSNKHANFIVNLGGGTADQVREVMRHVIEVVEQRTGFRLEPEVKLIGNFT